MRMSVKAKVTASIAMRHGASLCPAGWKLALQVSSSCVRTVCKLNKYAYEPWTTLSDISANRSSNEWNSSLAMQPSLIYLPSHEIASIAGLENLERNKSTAIDDD